MKCERCARDEEATYVVRSDLINMKVCAACADEAMSLRLAVEVLGGDGTKGNRDKIELAFPDYRSELLRDCGP